MFQIQSHTSKKSESVERLLTKLGESGVTLLHYGNGVDKLTQYQYFKEKGIPSPDFTTEYNKAVSWIEDGYEVVARTLIQGHAGHGVVVASTVDELPTDAKIYILYIKKKREFRVNIFKDVVVNVREKKRMLNATGSTKIRSQANGYTTTYAINVPQGITDLALKASKVSNSDFKGVDIIYNDFYKKAWVLEVNSGPSIEGQSVTDFANVILNYAY